MNRRNVLKLLTLSPLLPFVAAAKIKEPNWVDNSPPKSTGLSYPVWRGHFMVMLGLPRRGKSELAKWLKSVCGIKLTIIDRAEVIDESTILADAEAITSGGRDVLVVLPLQHTSFPGSNSVVSISTAVQQKADWIFKINGKGCLANRDNSIIERRWIIRTLKDRQGIYNEEFCWSSKDTNVDAAIKTEFLRYPRA
jgi:hypothetical protein